MHYFFKLVLGWACLGLLFVFAACSRISPALVSTPPSGHLPANLATASPYTPDSLIMERTTESRCQITDPLSVTKLASWFQRGVGSRAEINDSGLIKSYVRVNNGTDAWFYDDSAHLATWETPEFPSGDGYAVLWDFTSLDPNATPYQKVSPLGEDTYLGRRVVTYEITFAPRTGVKPGHCALPNNSFKVWIDLETHYEMRTESRAPSGELLRAQYVTRFEVNPKIEPSVFVFVPPPNTTLETGAREWRDFLAGLPPGYPELARELGFPLWIVRNLPPGFQQPQVPTYITSPHKKVVLEYVSSADGRSFTVTEVPSSANTPSGQGDKLLIGRREATFWVQGETRYLGAAFGGTYLTLSSAALSKDELVSLAQNMTRLRHR